MASLKKKDVEEFRVPTLGESDAAYAALLQRQSDLSAMLSKLHSERGELEKNIAEQPKSPYSAGVSRLLGDDEGAAPHLRKRRGEVLGEITDVETALVVIRKRLDEARNGASKAVCDAVRQEYQKRLGVVCDAARALEAARQSHDELIAAIEREDVNLAYLKPVHPFFMGDRREGKVFHFLKEVAEAHNV
ncbi:hypothetical protein [Bradyrhizobium monzae]|uniref:hypothetical protein n=1 Tax=Bradyrhizobium sp. Oc8 TaxID=2876780 RepID=UPI001F470D8D|nr:hypothetical protein [Bradyrhizobium sp. Oc8]